MPRFGAWVKSATILKVGGTLLYVASADIKCQVVVVKTRKGREQSRPFRLAPSYLLVACRRWWWWCSLWFHWRLSLGGVAGGLTISTSWVSVGSYIGVSADSGGVGRSKARRAGLLS